MFLKALTTTVSALDAELSSRVACPKGVRYAQVASESLVAQSLKAECYGITLRVKRVPRQGCHLPSLLEHPGDLLVVRCLA